MEHEAKLDRNEMGLIRMDMGPVYYERKEDC